jgi:hypothetical protein
LHYLVRFWAGNKWLVVLFMGDAVGDGGGPTMTKAFRTRGAVRQEKKRLGSAFWAEFFLASFTGFLMVLTLAWPDWVEGVFGVEPDHRNGSFEWELVVVCALLTVLFAGLARRAWRRAPLRIAATSGR